MKFKPHQIQNIQLEKYFFTSDFFAVFLAFYIHVFHINFLPRCFLPLIHTGTYNVNIVPQSLQIQKIYEPEGLQRITIFRMLSCGLHSGRFTHSVTTKKSGLWTISATKLKSYMDDSITMVIDSQSIWLAVRKLFLRVFNILLDNNFSGYLTCCLNIIFQNI